MPYQATPQLAPAAPLAPVDPAVAQLNALVTEQIVAVSRLTSLEGDRVTLEKQITMFTGKDNATLQSQLNATLAEIDGQRARIEQIRGRIAELQKSMPRGTASSAPPA